MNASEMAGALLLAIAPETRLGLPRLHPGQQQVIADARRFNVLAAGRRWGKNTLAEGRVILPVLQGKPAAWFSPTYKSLADDWRRLSEILVPVTKSKNEQERRIVLTSGGIVDMWSLDDPDAPRGRAYARVVIDEAASVKQLLYAWQQVIRPMLTDYSGDAWFISTPKGLNDFHTLYQWGQDPARSDWRSWQRPSSENPHIPADDLAAAERDLPTRAWQEEYLAKFLPGGVGQYFDEWDPAIHVCNEMPSEIVSSWTWRRFGMVDYGYSPDPFCYLQMALSPDGRGFVYLEVYRTKLVDSDQAGLIAEMCAQDPPEYVAAPPDLFNVSGKGIRGQSTAETYQQVWAKYGFRAQLRRVTNDRLQGWRRVREWLKPNPSADGQGQTARLQIVAGRCPNLVRTLPQLVHDEHKPEDLDTTGEDHAADALRYGLMSRPAPRPIVSLQVLEDYWAADPLVKRVMNRGNTPNYIGSEREYEQMVGSRTNEQYLRLIHPPRFRGPSER